MITKQHIKNLKKLAKFLRTVPDENFEMRFFRSNKEGNDVNYYSKNQCGTAGCALGWAPFVKGLEPIRGSEEWDSFPGIVSCLDYNKYAKRIFGLDYTSIEYDDMFEFLFSSNYYAYDNTANGAADRIEVFCKMPELFVDESELAFV